MRKLHEEKLGLLKDLREKSDALRAEQLLLKADAGKAEALVNLSRRETERDQRSRKKNCGHAGKINRLEQTISELASAENPSGQKPGGFAEEISALESEQRKCVSREAQVRAKVDDYKTILEKGVCPTCDRPVETHSFAERVEHRESGAASDNQAAA